MQKWKASTLEDKTVSEVKCPTEMSLSKNQEYKSNTSKNKFSYYCLSKPDSTRLSRPKVSESKKMYLVTDQC